MLAQYTESGKGIFGSGIELGGLFNNVKIDVDSYKKIIDDFKKIGDFSKYWEKDKFNWDAIAESIQGCDETALSYFKTLDDGNGTINNQSASVEGLSAHLKATGQSFNFAAIKATLLNTALNAGIALIASLALQGVIKLIDTIAHSAEHCKERVDELMSSYKSALDKANSNAATVEDLASRYEELSKGVNNLGQNMSLTTDEYGEYNDIVNQIADMFPGLIQGYTDEGTAILSLKGNVEQLRDAYKEAQQEAYHMLVISGKDSKGNDILKNANTVLNGNIFNPSRLKQVEFIDEIENALQDTEHLSALFNSLLDRNYDYVQWFHDFTGIYSESSIDILSADDLAQIREELQFTKKKYQSEINEATNNVKTMLEAYLKEDEIYKGLDEESARIASILVNSIDSEIAADFENNPSTINDYVLKVLEVVKNPDIHDSLIDLFSLNTDELPVTEAKDTIDQYIHELAAVLDENNEYELKVRLGFEDVDITYKRLQNAIRAITNTDDPLLTIVNADEYNKLAAEINWTEFTEDEAEFFIAATRGAHNATEAIRMYNEALKEASSHSDSTSSITQTVDQIDTQLKSAFDSLQSAYQEIFTLDENTGEKLFTSLEDIDITDKFNPILNALEELDKLDGINVNYSQFEDFVSVLSNTSSTAEEVQEQFNKLATDIIYTSDCTNMTVETFDLLAKSLSEMGVTNAYEGLEKIRNAQEELAALGYDVANITAEEASELIKLGSVYAETAEYLQMYLIQKELAQNPLSTLEDVTALENLCNALGVTGQLYEYVIDLKRAFDAKESGAVSAGLDESIEAIQAKIKELSNGEFDFGFNFDGLKNSNSSGKSSSSSTKDTTETFDWIEQAIENVEKDIKELDEIANSSYSTFSQKNEALAQEISKVSEEIDLQQQAYEEYMRKADSIPLSDHYRQFVQSGTINIEDISDKNLQDLISEYQDWYDKAQNVSDAIKELKTDMKDLYVSAYELQTDNLKNRLDSDSITQKQYLEGLKTAYEQFYANIEDFAEQYHEAVLNYLAEEKDYLNSVAGAAASLIDTEIDKIEDGAGAQEDIIQKQIDLLEAKKKPLQDELDALEDKAKRENLILNLQKAQQELAKAENQRKLVNYMPDTIVI